MPPTTQPTPAPAPQPQQPMQNTPKESSAGPIIATVIILAVIILGGLYFWGQHKDTTNTDQTVPVGQAVDDDTAAIETQSSSDDTASIETDLNNTNLDIDTDVSSQ